MSLSYRNQSIGLQKNPVGIPSHKISRKLTADDFCERYNSGVYIIMGLPEGYLEHANHLSLVDSFSKIAKRFAIKEIGKLVKA